MVQYQHQTKGRKLTMNRNRYQPTKSTNHLVKDILDGIATVFVFLMLGALALVFLAITGCANKSISSYQTLEPTYQVIINEHNELEIVVQAKSRDIGMAVNKAQMNARQELASYLNTNHLIGSRVALQQFATDESGIINIVTLKMVMPLPN